MIKLTRLNQKELMVNAEMIEFVEAIPDTIVTLTSGKKIMVFEPVDTVVERIVPDTAVYSALDNRDGTALLSGPVTTETYTVTYRGVEYERTRARLVSYEGAALLASGPQP